MNDRQADISQGFGNIDQIRDILFGSQLKGYSNRLDSLEATLKELKEDTDKRLTTLKLETDKSIDKAQQALSTEFKAAFEGLSEELKSMRIKDDEQKDEMGQQIERLSKRLSTNVATLDEALDKQTRSLRDDLLSSHRKLQGDLMDLRNQLFEHLEKRASTLAADKVAREDMAEMFFELVLKLKGTEFVPPWKEGAKSNESKYLLPEESEDKWAT